MKRTKYTEQKPQEVIVDKPIIDYSEYTVKMCRDKMTRKQIKFAHLYIEKDNGTQAAIGAGYKKKSATLVASENIRKPYLKRYIELLSMDIQAHAKEIGINKVKYIQKLDKIATAELPDMYDTWILRKELAILKKKNPALRAAIKEISSKTIQRLDAFKEPVEEEYVKVQLHDPLRAIETIFKAMGWYEPDKVDLTGAITTTMDITKYTDEEKKVLLELARKTTYNVD